MKKLLFYTIILSVLFLGACSKEDSKATSNKEPGKTTDVSDSKDSKAKDRKELKLKKNEIAVYKEDGNVEKLKAEPQTEEKYGLTANLPRAYSFGTPNGDAITISTPGSSSVELMPTDYDDRIKNHPKKDYFIKSKFERFDYEVIDFSKSKDSFIKENMVYLVKYKPKNEQIRMVYAGLIEFGNNKYYEFEIFLGNNKYSEDVLLTVEGIFASIK